MKVDYTDNTPVEIPHDEFVINIGRKFFFMDYYEAGASPTNLDFIFATGSNKQHMVFSVQCDKCAFTLQTYEGVISNNDGILLSLFNHNRNFQGVENTTMVVRKDPTGVDITGATRLRGNRIGVVGTPSRRYGGSLDAKWKTVLLPNTKYLVRINNLDAVDTWVDVKFSWWDQR